MTTQLNKFADVTHVHNANIFFFYLEVIVAVTATSLLFGLHLWQIS